ncbi:hypothetical protein [Brevundimonas sp.]|jgi:hypothetical protein|uniref:hypothetical protein n=1 Tax=Brevundimonas sp. TaxID=1871086 RepID=UPI00391D8AD1
MKKVVLAVGWFFVVAGFAQMYQAGQMVVSLPVDPSVANMDLVAQREMIFDAGGYGLLVGVIVLAASYVASAIDRLGLRLDRPE